MKNVNFEKWIKEVKNYYKLVRFIEENNYDSVPNVTYKFCDLLSEFNEMVLLYGKSICYIVCEKCTLKKLYDFKRTTKSSICEKYKDRVLE